MTRRIAENRLAHYFAELILSDGIEEHLPKCPKTLKKIAAALRGAEFWEESMIVDRFRERLLKDSNESEQKVRLTPNVEVVRLLDKSHELVEQLPDWKRGVLEISSLATNAEARTPVVENDKE